LSHESLRVSSEAPSLGCGTAMQVVQLRCGPGRLFYEREYATFPVDLNGLRFTSDTSDHADWLAQSSAENGSFETKIPRARRIFFISEPAGYFPPEYVNQFGIIVSPFAVSGFKGVWVRGHGALASFLGMEFSKKGEWRPKIGYYDLRNLTAPEKRDAISVVISRKSVLPGHRRRLEFVRRLSAALGSRLVIYGRGFRDIADKADAILPFKYHLVLENTVMPSYWTEKLADAWLGYAFPIMSGPPDLARWFPEESFLSIDIGNPEAAIEAIVRAMGDDLFARRHDDILEARTRILRDERLCPVIARVIAAHPNDAPRLAVVETIEPAPKPGLAYKLRREAARVFWQLNESARSRIGP
jgi:hypothetical protein